MESKESKQSYLSASSFKRSPIKLSSALLLLIGFAVLFVFTGISGCKKKIISKVKYELPANLERVRVQLDFDRSMQLYLGGSFPFAPTGREYGSIEVKPTTADAPFSVAFDLNTEILNDQGMFNFKPAQTLPSGQQFPPLVPKDRAMFEVTLKNGIDPNYDVAVYIDPYGEDENGNGRGGEWIGVALTLKFFDAKYFPPELAVYQNFLKSNQDGNYHASVAVFGPKVDENKNILQYGGIALFANVKALIKEARAKQSLAGGDKGANYFLFDGKLAPHYQSHSDDAYMLNEAFKLMLKENGPRPPASLK